jgi:D-serine deaminase-like pyridoxal phosphate-dependent protein
MGERLLRYLTMHISEIDTPVPVVDYDIARRNIRRLQEYCDVGEAEIMAQTGLTDILITAGVLAWKNHLRTSTDLLHRKRLFWK